MNNKKLQRLKWYLFKGHFNASIIHAVIMLIIKNRIELYNFKWPYNFYITVKVSHSCTFAQPLFWGLGGQKTKGGSIVSIFKTFQGTFHKKWKDEREKNEPLLWTHIFLRCLEFMRSLRLNISISRHKLSGCNPNFCPFF